VYNQAIPDSSGNFAMQYPGENIKTSSILKKLAYIVAISVVVFITTIFIFGNRAHLQTEPQLGSPQPSFEKPFAKLPSPAKSNLTNSVGEAIAKEIIEQNPEGPGTDLDSQTNYIKSRNPEELIEQTLAEALAKFEPADLRPSLKDSDIIISNKTSREDQLAYIEKYNQINSSVALGVSITEEDFKRGNLAQMVSVFENLENQLLQTPVPRPLADFHKEAIELAAFQKNLTLLIADYNNDPAQAILALNETRTAEQEIQGLQKSMQIYFDNL